MNVRRIVPAAIQAAVLVWSTPGGAHEQWPDGSTVSDQIKRKCCGPADIHFLPPGSVHALSDGWHIDGFQKVVPFGMELPSPDGNEWGFWADHRYEDFKAVGGQSEMLCLFLNPHAS